MPVKPLHFSDIFPDANVRVIKSGSELFLAYALNKYSMYMLGRPFEIDDVAIDRHLLRSDEMVFVRRYGIKLAPKYCSVALSAEDKRREAGLNLNRFYTVFSDDIKFVSRTMTEYVVDFTLNDPENRKMVGAVTSTAYVDLWAYTLIQGYRTNTKIHLIINNRNQAPRPYEYSNLIILRDCGNKLLTDSLCSFYYGVDPRIQPDYEAFLMYNNQRGYMARAYSVAEKFRAAHQWVQGDVVLVYRHKNDTKKRLFKPVKSCTMAVIRSVEKDGIVLAEYPSIATKLTQSKEVDTQRAINPQLYTEQDKFNYPVTIKKFSWDAIGIDICTYDEGTFITNVTQDDGSYQWLMVGGVEQQMWLSTPDTCYAVLSDRNAPFNKERFVERYFTPYNKIPVWEQIKQV